MTNRIAVVLGGLLVLAIVLDMALNGSDHLVYLGKKLVELIEWIAFWR